MDMLVKLYDLRLDAELEARIAAHGFEIRPALPPELHVVTRWIASRFGEGWASEATIAMSRQPVSCLLAIAEGKLAGFACYDATARGFFGPTGVDESHRGKGVGQALLLRALLAMRDIGYGYAVIGSAGPMDFYRRTVGAIAIEGSKPGIYRGMLDLAPADPAAS